MPHIEGQRQVLFRSSVAKPLAESSRPPHFLGDTQLFHTRGGLHVGLQERRTFQSPLQGNVWPPSAPIPARTRHARRGGGAVMTAIDVPRPAFMDFEELRIF